jgi:hypothetical protein
LNSAGQPGNVDLHDLNLAYVKCQDRFGPVSAAMA